MEERHGASQSARLPRNPMGWWFAESTAALLSVLEAGRQTRWRQGVVTDILYPLPAEGTRLLSQASHVRVLILLMKA